jgi:plasminogen activator inhibitor 1 RNA-binding protein
MDVEYGIGIKNKYDLQVDADPDFLQVKPKKAAKKQAATASTGSNSTATTTAGPAKKSPLQKVNVNSEKPKAASAANTRPAKPASNAAATNSSNNAINSSAKPTASGDFKTDRPRTGKTDRRPAKEGFSRDRPFENRPERSERPEGERRDFGKDARDRRGPRGAPGQPPSRRDFDRKSNSDKTGVKPTEKREGFGKSNWGNFKDDEADAWGEETRPTEEAPANDENERPVDLSTDEITEVPLNDEPVEEEAQVFTLDEWRKQQEKERVVPQYNVRKAGEGDTQQWQKGYVLKKKNQDEEVEYEEIEVVSDFWRFFVLCSTVVIQLCQISI